MDRRDAVDLVEDIVDDVESGDLPVPVREVWVFGDLALGLDPVHRLDVYLTKDVLMRGDDADREREFADALGVEGIGTTVRASWAEAHPEYVRANESGHVAPERCLAAQLLPEDAPVHLEVCNSSFDDNVTRRLEGAMATDSYEQIIDPRGAALWIDGVRDDDAIQKLREGELVFPTLPEALQMIGMEKAESRDAAAVLAEVRQEQEGASVRGDVV